EITTYLRDKQQTQPAILTASSEGDMAITIIHTYTHTHTHTHTHREKCLSAHKHTQTYTHTHTHRHTRKIKTFYNFTVHLACNVLGLTPNFSLSCCLLPFSPSFAFTFLSLSSFL